jgi:glycosyltransferase involved in cell wall biosynthesis
LLFPQNGVWGAIVCRIVRFLKGTPFIYLSAGGKNPPIVRQKPDLYIALNPPTRDWIKSYRPGIKVVLIPYGVDLEKFSPKIPPRKIDLEKPIYLCVAAAIPAKRIELAIKAAASLKQGSLLIVGDGPLKRELAELGGQLLGERRFLITQFPYEEMPGVYTACDVFTLPSFEEPFGIVYLEALASGLPVVAPNDRSRGYIVGGAGVLCPVENLKEYSWALVKAVRSDFGDKPRKQAEKFSWEKIGGR